MSKKLSKTFISYIAGLIDGEGSIQINPSKSTKGVRYWGLTVQIASSAKNFLEPIKKIWNIGSLTYWKSKYSTAKKTSVNWRFYSKDSKIILTKTLPFLRLKKKHAIIALDFLKLKGFKKNTLTKKIISKRRNLAMRIRELNKKTGKATSKLKHLDVR